MCFFGLIGGTAGFMGNPVRIQKLGAIPNAALCLFFGMALGELAPALTAFIAASACVISMFIREKKFRAVLLTVSVIAMPLALAIFFSSQSPPLTLSVSDLLVIAAFGVGPVALGIQAWLLVWYVEEEEEHLASAPILAVEAALQRAGIGGTQTAETGEEKLTSDSASRNGT